MALAGEIRTLPYAVPNFKAAVLTPLAADLFMDVSHSRWKGTAEVWLDAHGLKRKRGLKRRADEWPSILDALRPLHVHVSDGEPGNVSTYYGLFTRWARLHAAIVAHERRLLQQYDWVVRTRPDLLYTCRLSPSLLQHSSAHALLKWDLVSLLPRDAAAILLTIGSRHVNCRCRGLVDVCIPSVLYAHSYPFSQSVGKIVNVGDIFARGPCETASQSPKKKQVPPLSRLDCVSTDFATRLRHDTSRPELIAVILRDGEMASASGIANGTQAHCSAASFQPKSRLALYNEYDDAVCTTAARRGDSFPKLEVLSALGLLTLLVGALFYWVEYRL